VEVNNFQNRHIRQNDEDDNNNNNRQIRGRYLKPTRDNAIAIIKKMIVDDNYDPNEVRDMLNIPARSFERYLHQAFEEEREGYVKSVGTTRILDKIAVVEARINKDRRDLINLANDKNVEPKRLMACVEAYKVAGALNMAILKLHDELLPKLFTERKQIDYTDAIHITVSGKRMSLRQYINSLPDDEVQEEEQQNNNKLNQEQQQQQRQLELQQKSREQEAWDMANQRGELGVIGSEPPEWWINDYRAKQSLR
jgi:hypothetical protein